MYIAKVKYQIGTYSGEINVNSNDIDHDYIIVRAKRILKKYDTLGMAYRHYEIVEVKEY